MTFLMKNKTLSKCLLNVGIIIVTIFKCNMTNKLLRNVEKKSFHRSIKTQQSLRPTVLTSSKKLMTVRAILLHSPVNNSSNSSSSSNSNIMIDTKTKSKLR